MRLGRRYYPTLVTLGGNAYIGEFVPVDTHGRGLLLVRPDHQLGRYDKLMIEEVGFRYSNHQVLW